MTKPIWLEDVKKAVWCQLQAKAIEDRAAELREQADNFIRRAAALREEATELMNAVENMPDAPDNV